MRILISNDDGIYAPGISVLARAAEDLGEVYVVAPDSEQSAKSHGLTMHEPLRVRHLGPRRFSVTGTPADAVYMALHQLLPGPPDLVLSGVNRGANLGSDVHYSGTVAAAREAALRGLPAVAVSLFITDFDDSDTHYDTAAQAAVEICRSLLADPLPPGVFLNINAPDVPRAQVKGVRVAPVGEHKYADQVSVGEDPRGRPYYWIGGPRIGFAGGEHTDGELVEQGYIAVTPSTPTRPRTTSSTGCGAGPSPSAEDAPPPNSHHVFDALRRGGPAEGATGQ